MEDKLECLHCGQPVRKVAQHAKYWGKGEPPEEWVHKIPGGLNCDKHFLRAGEVVTSGPEVPVQD